MELLESFRNILLVIALMALPAIALADDDDDDEHFEVPYTGRVSIEPFLGASWNLKSYSKLPDKGTAALAAEGPQFALGMRLVFFPKKQLGCFAEISYSQQTDYNEHLTDKVDNQSLLNYDGSPARRHLGSTDSDTYCWYYGWDNYRAVTFLVGATCRYDVSHWSFRPRLGVGIRAVGSSDNCVMIVQQNSLTTRTEYIHSYRLEDKDYTKCDYYHAFAYSPGLQICLTPRHHMYFYVDVSWLGTLSKLHQASKVQVVNGKETLDSYGHFYYLETWGAEQLRTQRVSMGNFLNVRAGVGWNIGK